MNLHDFPIRRYNIIGTQSKCTSWTSLKSSFGTQTTLNWTNELFFVVELCCGRKRSCGSGNATSPYQFDGPRAVGGWCALHEQVESRGSRIFKDFPNPELPEQNRCVAHGSWLWLGNALLALKLDEMGQTPGHCSAGTGWLNVSCALI